jgi:phytoene desaturase
MEEPMKSPGKPTVIIGAGLGGLSAAIHLAAAGRRVLILEQNESVGGKVAQLRADGFTWDTGPSVLTMVAVFEELFAVGGARLEDYLTLEPVEPLTRYFYPDGVVLNATRDLSCMAAQIGRLNARDVEGYLGFLAHAAALDRITSPVFIRGDPPKPRDILRVPLRDMLQVDAWRTMDAAIRHWVRDPHLRMLLGRFATYVGASPYQAPAVLNVIAHAELTSGIWYAKGGIYSVAQAYRALAEELGVKIEIGRRVTAIEVETGRDTHATGVRLEDGTRIEAEAVIANVDVTTVYEHLLPPTLVQRRYRRLARVAPSLSGFVLLLGLRGQTPELAQHNILFPRDYRREFDEIFRQGIPPQEPTLYVSISARQDPEHAPEGDENWFVLVNVPPLAPGFDWRAEAPRYRDLVLDRLTTAGFEVRPRIASEHVLTPQDLETRTGAWRGSLYGASSNQTLAALRRPHPRDPLIRGLYFAGGTTHPGGGVPMVTLSGGVAARMLLADGRAGEPFKRR